MNINLLISYEVGIYFQVVSLLNEIDITFNQLIPNGPSLGDKVLDVILAAGDNPMTYPNFLPVKYTIGLTVKNWYPLQIVYQFAHEYCHVYIDPRLTNWLIESFCEAMSFIILDIKSSRLALTDLEWSMHYSDYINLIKNEYLHQLNLTLSETQSLNVSDRIISLKTPFDRSLNFISAWKIYRLYKTNPEVLSLVPFLHNTKHIDILPINQYIEDIQPNLNSLYNSIPETLKPIWLKLKLSLDLYN